jgi:DNA polymerase-3 subunit delta'
MLFSKVPYLEAVKQILRKSATNSKVAHAQLFYSGEGTASLSLALAYFGYLNCEHPSPDDVCGECSSCSKVAKLIHPDLHFIFPVTTNAKFTKASEALSQNFLPEFRKQFLSNPYFGLSDWAACYGAENKQPAISKEDARNINRALSMKAYEAQYKAVLIFLPELMHPAAANAILKILEEPAEKTLFLLVSHAPDQMMPTILSRTQKIQVPHYTEAEIESILIQNFGIEPHRANQAAFLCQRNLAAALRLAEEDQQEGMMPFFQNWMRNAFKRDFGVLLDCADEFAAMTKPAQTSFIDYSTGILREVLLSKYAPDLTRLRSKESEFVAKFGSVLSMEKIEKMVFQLNKSRYHLLRNANAKIEFSNLSLELAKVFAQD